MLTTSIFDLLKGSKSTIRQIVSSKTSSLAIFSYLSQQSQGVYSEEEIKLWKMSIKVVSDLLETGKAKVVFDKNGKTLVFSFEESGEKVDGSFVDGRQVFVKEKTLAESVLGEENEMVTTKIEKSAQGYQLVDTDIAGNVSSRGLEFSKDFQPGFFTEKMKLLLRKNKTEEYKSFLDEVFNLIKNEKFTVHLFSESAGDVIALNSIEHNVFAFLTGLQDENILQFDQVMDYLVKRKNIWFAYDQGNIVVYRQRKIGRFFLPKRFSKIVGNFKLSKEQDQLLVQNLKLQPDLQTQYYIRAIGNELYGKKEHDKLTEHIQSFLKHDIPVFSDMLISDPKMFLMVDKVASKLQQNVILFNVPEKEYFYSIAYTLIMELFLKKRSQFSRKI